MNPNTLILLVLFLAGFGFLLGKSRSLRIAEGDIRNLHSLPAYYGIYIAFWCGIPALLFLSVWLFFDETIITQLVVADLPHELRALSADRMTLVVNDIKNLAGGNIVSSDPDASIIAAAKHYNDLSRLSIYALFAIVSALCTGGLSIGARSLRVDMRARNHVEKTITVFLIACSTVAVFTTIGIVLSVLFESIRFFQKVPVHEFLFGLKWSPQVAMRADQVGSSGEFGSLPLLAGTFLISFIAMVVAVPIGLMSAIFMSEYATPKLRAVVKPVLEILAGIPTVVYGYFAALTMAPFVRDFCARYGFEVASESALAAGLVMGIMIIPFVSSLSDDVISAVPRSMRDGSLGLGATQSETILRVLVPAALPGIVASVLLAVSRAIGETMIVVMAAGLTANMTANPFEAVTTVTVQIVTLLVGDQEFDSAKTLAAFALGLLLFVMTLMLNIIALVVVRKYREQYE